MGNLRYAIIDNISKILWVYNRNSKKVLSFSDTIKKIIMDDNVKERVELITTLTTNPQELNGLKDSITAGCKKSVENLDELIRDLNDVKESLISEKKELFKEIDKKIDTMEG